MTKMKYANTLIILQVVNMTAVYLSTRLTSMLYPLISVAISLLTGIIIICLAVDKEEEK